jgi:xanthine/uracil permease
MFNFAVSRESLLSGFQWFFFIFCNTVVVPPTLLSAFQLPQSSLLTLTQYAFLATALACFAQAFCGHRRAIMEGPGGLWWGTILTISGLIKLVTCKLPIIRIAANREPEKLIMIISLR